MKDLFCITDVLSFIFTGIYGCDVHPCLNNGTCVPITSGDRNYKCNCVPGKFSHHVTSDNHNFM